MCCYANNVMKSEPRIKSTNKNRNLVDGVTKFRELNLRQFNEEKNLLYTANVFVYVCV